MTSLDPVLDWKSHPSVPPVVPVATERVAEQIRVARRTAGAWQRLFPGGMRCAVHEDFAARGVPGRCGVTIGQIRRDPFPGTFKLLGENGFITCAFVVVLDPDGLWRPVPGGLCGFHLTAETVAAGVSSGRWRIVRDLATGEIMLADPGKNEPPTIRMEEWAGTCTICGQCCGSRAGTDWPCDALEPPEG